MATFNRGEKLGLAVVAWGLVGMSFTSTSIPKNYRLMMLGGAAAISTFLKLKSDDDVTEILQSKAVRRELTTNTLLANAIGFNINQIDWTAQPTPVALPTATTKQFDLDKFVADRNKHPHIMLIGKTGGGKSTTAQYLASFLPGKKYAVAPHFDFGKQGKSDEDWQSCNGVFGTGRNYGDEDDEKITYDDLVHNRISNATAYQCLQSIFSEMDRRYKDHQSSFDSHECHDWFIDECPAIAAQLDKLFAEYLRPLIYEARKIGIRLWLVTQSDRVQALKIQGTSDIKENFTYVYLANAAKAKARKLEEGGHITQNDLSTLLTQKYPCIIDDSVSTLPSLDEVQNKIRSALPTERFVQLPTSFDFDPDSYILKAGKIKGKTLDELKQFVGVYYKLYLHGKDKGLTQTQIIEKLWGLGAKKFNLGKELFSYILTLEKAEVVE